MKFSITKKITLPFAIILFLMGGMALDTYISQTIDKRGLEDLDRQAQHLQIASQLQRDLGSMLMAINDFVLTSDTSYRTSYRALLSKTQADLSEFGERVIDPSERVRLLSIQTALFGLDELAKQVFALRNAKNDPYALRLMQELHHRFGSAMYGQTGHMIDESYARVAPAIAAVQGTAPHQIWMAVIPAFIVLGISIATVLLTTRRISGPLLSLVAVAERVAARDFSSYLKSEAEDEISLLEAAFNFMKEEIQRRYEELENFANIIANDLRNPITSIKEFSKTLLDDYGRQLKPEASENLRRIGSTCTQMTELIQEMLDFAHAGKIEFYHEPVSMQMLLEDIKLDLATYAKEQNATVAIESNLPAVTCDPVRFSQMWRNLISNAIKYNNNPEPRVEIGTEIAKDRSHFQFFLRDNGIGIDESHFETIFLPFKRLADSIKYEGTGIDLAIAKRVIDSHGGKIWATSDADGGTTFHFTVPKSISF
ncbi:MAG: HAMP domain-containing protein [Ignavibacteriales bacterium]|nr:HAMP domain-containing protein [Ignavibacteriales bacterium]